MPAKKKTQAPTSMAEKQFIARKKLAWKKSVHARYDAAQTNNDNKRHWAASDDLSPDQSASAGVRRILRRRSRYEVANNSYASGLVTTLSNDRIATGPRLQLVGDGESEDKAVVENLFKQWSDEINLAEKLRVLSSAWTRDGEGFAMHQSNPRLQSRVKLDLVCLEAERIASPTLQVEPAQERYVDGILFDQFHNPVSYTVLRQHPGDTYYADPDSAIRVKARQMVHLFRADRPEQHRGIPELTPALGMFAQLRRWTLAILTAAETAADFAALLYTDMPPDGEAEPSTAFDSMEIEKGMMTSIPGGWKMGQFKAEHPQGTYVEFKREVLNEIGRCLDMPYNIVAANSSGYNYSSGRLDWQTYYRKIEVDRQRIELIALANIFAAWRWEAIKVEDYLPQSMRNISTDWRVKWLWPGFEHVDPLKEAQAQEIRLRNNVTTLAYEVGRTHGADWEELLDQRQREVDGMRSRGLPSGNSGDAATPADADDDDDAANADDDDGDSRAQAHATGFAFVRDDNGRLTGVAECQG